jgi:hypothetical protein
MDARPVELQWRREGKSSLPGKHTTQRTAAETYTYDLPTRPQVKSGRVRKAAETDAQMLHRIRGVGIYR